MLDSFGSELKEGMVVEISGSCVKQDNGLFVVTTHDRFGNEYKEFCFCDRLNKDMRKAKGSKTSQIVWPLQSAYMNEDKRLEVDHYNLEHATIRVLCPWVEPKAKPSANTLKLQKRGVKKGDLFIPCWYAMNDDGNIWITAKQSWFYLPEELGNIQNASDGRIDYYDNDHVLITKDSPYYEAAKRCCV